MFNGDIGSLVDFSHVQVIIIIWNLSLILLLLGCSIVILHGCCGGSGGDNGVCV